MRSRAATIAADADLAEFRRRFPLGSTRRVVALDDGRRYAGIVPVSAVYADEDAEGRSSAMAILAGRLADAGYDDQGDHGPFRPHRERRTGRAGRGPTVLGVLSEAYATRRYAEELEKARRDLVGSEP